MPALYRIHEGPEEEKLSDLREFLGELGLSPGRRRQARAPRTTPLLLEQVGERPDRHLIQTVLLRSLSQAVYSPDNVGHFGLAYPAYTHFTSPIRRYPDLLVHRAIKHLLGGGTARGFRLRQARNCRASASTAPPPSAAPTRRPAMPSRWLKCEYMLDKVGEEFDGTITGVTSFGLFVELDEVYVDGLVHITALDNDYYHFDPVGHRLTGERTGHGLPPRRPRAGQGRRGQSGRAQDRLRVGTARGTGPGAALTFPASAKKLKLNRKGAKGAKSYLPGLKHVRVWCCILAATSS